MNILQMNTYEDQLQVKMKKTLYQYQHRIYTWVFTSLCHTLFEQNIILILIRLVHKELLNVSV